MKLRKALGTVVGAVGATAAANRVLQSRAGAFEPMLDGEQGTYRWRGFDIAYTEAGDPSDPDLVLFHGINAAGSSGEFREIVDALAETHHVVAPDYPGFGRSDRPPLRYSAALYEDFVADFLAEYESPAVVASSFSGAYVARAATDRRVTIDSLLTVCPTTRAGPEPPKTWLRELLRAPILGTACFDALVSKPSIRYFNADHAYAAPGAVSEAWTDYQWRTTHQPNARFAVASFVAGHCNSDLDLGPALRDLDAPVTVVWGRDATLPPLSDGRALADEAAARLVVFDHAKLLPHVEHPDAFVDAVREAI